MANTYTQIHIQTVFCVENRNGLIKAEWKDELYKYITAIVQKNGHKLLIINGMPDHIHLFFRVIKYIQNQERHHQKKTFLQEYKEMLDAFGINYDDRFLFKPVELE